MARLGRWVRIRRTERDRGLDEPIHARRQPAGDGAADPPPSVAAPADLASGRRSPVAGPASLTPPTPVASGLPARATDDRTGFDRLGMTKGLGRLARWGIGAWSLIGILILGYVAYRFLVVPFDILFPPVLIALAIVYILNPLVSRLERRGVRRGWGTLATYVVFFAAVGSLVRLLIPLLSRQVSSFAESVPELLERVQVYLADLAARFNVNIDTKAIVGAISPEGSAGAFIERLFGITTGVVHVVLHVVVGAVLGFYLLLDLPKIQRAVARMIPSRRLPEIQSVMQDMGRALGGYFRGQLLVALTVGVMSMLALWIVGLPYWALVGSVAGLFNLIPLIGPWIAAVPAMFIAFTTGESEGLMSLEPGWPLALGAGLVLIAVQQIDNHVISPNVVARTVKLHPITVLLGLLAAGTLFGLLGMLLVVPTIACVKILVLHYWDTRMQWPPPGSREEGVPSASG